MAPHSSAGGSCRASCSGRQHPTQGFLVARPAPMQQLRAASSHRYAAAAGAAAAAPHARCASRESSYARVGGGPGSARVPSWVARAEEPGRGGGDVDGPPPRRGSGREDGRGVVKTDDQPMEDADELYLRKLWADSKRDLKRNLGEKESAMLDDLGYEDMMDFERLMRKVTEGQLGPVLQSMGIQEDPLAFFVEVVKLATFLQLVTCGALFYGAELIGSYDTGER
eukprot:358674-Chlamydomonas_euryale.AAC.4